MTDTSKPIVDVLDASQKLGEQLVSAVTANSFDLAAELLAAQKDFAVKLARTFTPAKTAE